MKLEPIPELPDLILIDPEIHRDERGFFLETYQQERYRERGLTVDFVQDNHSRSKKGVLRGLHFQHPNGQGKLVRVSRGEVYDVAVDVRVGSPTFGRWHGVRLSDENGRQLYIPPGFAHGFVVLRGEADFEYKCTDYYAPDSQHSLRWDDPEVEILWPVEDPTLSEADASGLSLRKLREAGSLPQLEG